MSKRVWTSYAGVDMRYYQIWKAMLKRCYKPNATHYDRYGGRGIKVCPEWVGSYATFLKDMGDRPTPHHTLDRIDNDGDYTPENCRWATREEQHNNRTGNVKITYKGKTQGVNQWARELNINTTTLHYRLKMGWPLAEALTNTLRRNRG